eukprot:CAMPEP_0197515544 /NCGR_PEP_ID=MMETSP1318-20131121/648_1 /TAXON_ID=552666 /ORGANISM="Partenskyella glossopodia, Strain RCC365" /LENGTH=228 /DNA_ID=CAMNT_0043063945 /DNA_START=674 /DNA_END=1356 /DNA_ORIENTATION=-
MGETPLSVVGGVSCMYSICVAMGRLAAVDALFYSDGDRLPIVSQTNGNGGNIIISNGNCRVTAIDNGINFINTDTNVGKHRQDVYIRDTDAVFNAILSNPKSIAPSLLAVRKMMVRYINWSPPDDFLLPLQEGFVEGAKNILEEFPDMSRFKELLDLLYQVEPTIPGLASINLEFIENMLNLFKSIFKRHHNNASNPNPDPKSPPNPNPDPDPDSKENIPPPPSIPLP